VATRLTDRLAKVLPVPPSGNRITYDSDVAGYGLRVTANGNRSFILNYRRKADGIERRWTIGAFPDWSVGAARDEAKRLKRIIDGGGDPVGDIHKSRAGATVAELCARFEREVLPRNRPSTQLTYRQQIAAEVLPALGRRKVASVTYADIDALHRSISARAPTRANRIVSLLTRLFNLAVRWDIRVDNPCRGIERNTEHRRQRYLSADELARLSTALANLPDQAAANVVRLLLLTGARRGEALAARWSDFDLVAGVWSKPAASTKQNRPHRIPLSDAACRLLRQMQAEAGKGAYWLFPERGKPGHRSNIRAAWDTLRKAAGISDARVHDLRHTFASLIVSQGDGLPVIGALLGHTTPATTARYAHLLDDPLRKAVERAANVIAGRR